MDSHTARGLAPRDLLDRRVEARERLYGRRGAQMNHFVALCLELVQKQRDGCGRGRVNIMHQDDAAATLLKRGYHPMDGGCGVAATPVEGVDVDGELGDVAALQIGDRGIA